MFFIVYVLIAILLFILLIWNNNRKGEYYDDVIFEFYLIFSAAWIFYIPLMIIEYVLKKIANLIRGESK